MKTRRTPLTVLAVAALAVAATGAPARVVRARAEGPTIDTIAGRWLGDGWPVTAAALNFGNAVHVDRTTGTLYVEDGHNDGRIRRVSPGADAVVDRRPDEIVTTVVRTDDLVVGLTSDAAGGVWYAKIRAGLVIRVDPSGAQTIVAGGGTAEPAVAPAPATSVALTTPTRIALDEARGVLYICEAAANRVLALEGGSVSVVAGASGVAGFGGDGLPATAPEVMLSAPDGLAVDAAGNLFVADSGNARVRRIDRATGVITTAAVIPDPDGMGLNIPQGLACDAATGELFVTTGEGQRVWRIDPDGAVTPFAGNGATELPPGATPDGTPATAKALAFPIDVDVDSAGDVYIRESLQVTKVSRATGLASRLVGVAYGERVPAGLGLITFPSDIAVDARGFVYVADSYTRLVRMFDPRTGTIETVVGSFGSGYRDGHTRTEAQFNQLNEVAIGKNFALDIAEGRNATIRKAFPGADGVFDGSPDERVVTVAGTAHRYRFAPIPDDVSPLGPDARFSPAFIKSVAEDRFGNLFVADSLQNVVYRISAGVDGEVNGDPTETIRRVAGTGAYLPGPENVPGRESPLAFPAYVTFDAAGNLFVADQDCGRVRRLAPATPGGEIVGDPGEIITTVAGPTGAEPGEAPLEGRFAYGYAGDGGPATAARFFGVQGMDFDPDGNLYLADIANARVRRVDHGGDHLIDGGPGETITTVAGNGALTLYGDGVGGDPVDDFRDGVRATSTSLSFPFAVAVDASGNVYVADTIDGVIRQIYVEAKSLAVAPRAIEPAPGREFLTVEEFFAPLGASDVDPDSATIQALDPLTRLPLGSWAYRAPGSLVGAEGRSLALRFEASALAGIASGEVLVRQRVRLADGRYAAAESSVRVR